MGLCTGNGRMGAEKIVEEAGNGRERQDDKK